MRRPRVAAATAVLTFAALTLSAISVESASASIPSNAHGVFVQPDKVMSNVNQALQPAGTIAGTVTAVTGGGAVEAEVDLVNDAGEVVEHVESNASTGAYVLRGLVAATGTYHVCVDGPSASGGGATSGYVGTCYPAAPWPTQTSGLPAGATAISVATGQQVTGIDVALPTAAAIAGTVTDATSAPVGGVDVQLVNPDDGTKYQVVTGSAGHYIASGLTASATGYTVCFDASKVTTGTGLISECNSDVSWDGKGLPTGTTPVPVTVGTLHNAVDASLAVGGAIIGHVETHTATPQAVAHVPMALFVGGTEVQSTQTNATGGYEFRGLPSEDNYEVCADRYLLSVIHRLEGQCFKGVAWAGSGTPPAASSTAIPVAAGGTRTGVRFALNAQSKLYGTISGRVRAVNGPTVGDATVVIFADGRDPFTQVTTDQNGNYTVELPTSKAGYVVCAEAPKRSVDPSEPVVGWSPRCYGTNGAWEGAEVPPPAREGTSQHQGPKLGAHPVAVKTGKTAAQIDIQLHDGAAIDGHAMTGGSTSQGIDGVHVIVFDDGGNAIAESTTAGPNGTYAFNRLLAPEGDTTLQNGVRTPFYYVCFNGLTAKGMGYLPECYHNAAWSGRS